MAKFLGFIIVLFVPVIVYCQDTTNQIVIAVNGVSEMAIVVPNDAIASEKYAAQVLQKYLFEVSRVRLDIINESETRITSNYLYVGLGSYVKRIIANERIAKLGADGIVIKSLNRNLIIAGGRPRGSLNAVYQFLENYIGCRWWTPTENFIPKLSRVVLAPISLYYVPQFQYRDHFIYNTLFNSDFASKLKENGDDQNLSINEGGNVKILGFVHTFSKILPPKKYFKSHPEWYSDINNHDFPCTVKSQVPEGQKTQLCLSNEDLYKEFLKNLIILINSNPDYHIVSVSPNDYNGYCNCDNCKRIIAEEGSYSGLVLRFVNRIAAALSKIYPNLKVETLAYNNSIIPPKITRPRDNVIIRIAPIKINFAYPIASEQNIKFKEYIQEWCKISRNNYFWGYNTNFSNLLMPHPSLSSIGDNLKFLASYGFKGVFIQDNKYTNGVGYFLDMKAWVIGHLLWNPNLDQRKLENEFFSKYYGAGGQFLEEFNNSVDSSCKATKGILSTYNNDFSFLSLNLMNRGSLLFKRALDAVKGNIVFTNRILKEKLDLDFAWLNRFNSLKKESFIMNKPFMGPQNFSKSVDEVFKNFKLLGVSEIDQKSSIQDYRKKFVTLNFDKNDFSSKSIIIQQDNFRLYKNEEITGIVNDPLASDRKAAFIKAISNEWGIQINLNDYASAFKSNKWVVDAYVKIEKKQTLSEKKGGFVNIGVYNSKNKVMVSKKSIPITQLTSSNYLKITLSPSLLSNSEFVWFSINNNDNNIKYLLVDKIVLNKVD